MPALTAALRAEYAGLFASCAIPGARAAAVASTVATIRKGEARYRAVEASTGVPWSVVGVLHSLEAGCSFGRHLHNGDPLSARTTHVPAGRPVAGSPPFTWETSAADALALRQMTTWRDWTIAGTLYQLEGYNGFGYRTKHGIRSPYLWAATSQEQPGHYVADGHFDPSARSQQIGAAALLRSLAPSGATSSRAPGSPLLTLGAVALALGAALLFLD